MKKLLIASTALVLVAGAAAAEVKMTGDARFGLRYNDAATINGVAVVEDFVAEYRVRAKFNFSGTTDSGMGFGAEFLVNGVTSAASDAVVWVSDSWGQVTFGAVDTGDDSVGLGIAEIGYNGIGVDDIAESLYAGTAANVNYTGTFGAISVGLSYALPVSQTVAGSNDWAMGVGYAGDGFTVALGYDSNEVLSIGGGVTMGAISAHVLFSDASTGEQAYGVDFGYKLNSATTLTAVFTQDDTRTGYGIGVAYNLGGGAKLIAGIGSVDRIDTAGTVATIDDFVTNDTKAEFGMTFSF